jgi:Flp pilus assembly protein TadD
MAEQASPDTCPADLLAEAIETTRRDDAEGLRRVEVLARDYPRDARLHFLLGSLLAGLGRYGEAHAAMRAAVEIAPGYAIARFQLGFLELTSGDAAAAEATWRPLLELPPTDPLRLFAGGLGHLARDEFAAATDLLAQGMARNTDNPAMNADMQLLIDRMRETQADQARRDEPISVAHLLLRQYVDKSTRH